MIRQTHLQVLRALFLNSRRVTNIRQISEITFHADLKTYYPDSNYSVGLLTVDVLPTSCGFHCDRGTAFIEYKETANGVRCAGRANFLRMVTLIPKYIKPKQ